MEWKKTYIFNRYPIWVGREGQGGMGCRDFNGGENGESVRK